MPIIKTGDLIGDAKTALAKAKKQAQQKYIAAYKRKIRPLMPEITAEGGSLSVNYLPDDRVQIGVVGCSDALSARINQAVKHLL